MTEATNFRQERIEKLLHELRYEIERGMMERDIEETLSFKFIVPVSRAIPNGVVYCKFETRPVHEYEIMMRAELATPRLRVVK